MDINKFWDRAVKKTEILRSRVQALQTFGDTKVPYILLSESSINLGDTVVRKGEILVQKPSLILPPNIPQLEGFDFEDRDVHQESLINFLYVRGIHLPSLSYNHRTHSLDIFEGRLNNAVREYKEQLQQQENTTVGLLTGPEDCWQFSVLIFVCAQIARNADTDIRKILEKYQKREDEKNS